MSQTQPKHWINILLGLLASILLISAFLIAYPLFKKSGGEPKETKAPTTTESAITKDNDFEVNNYETYYCTAEGFGFILADIEINDNLEQFSCDSPLYQDASYLEKAQQYLDLSAYRLGIALGANKLFIPYKDETNIIIKTDTQQYHFNLNNPTYLKNGSATPTPTSAYELKISDVYLSSMMLRDEAEYNYPSTIQIYTFKVEVVTNKVDGLYIKAATLYVDGQGYEALDTRFYSYQEDLSSIIDIALDLNTRGALFFEVYCPEGESVNLESLIIELSNGDILNYEVN